MTIRFKKVRYVLATIAILMFMFFISVADVHAQSPDKTKAEEPTPEVQQENKEVPKGQEDFMAGMEKFQKSMEEMLNGTSPETEKYFEEIQKQFKSMVEEGMPAMENMTGEFEKLAESLKELNLDLGSDLGGMMKQFESQLGPNFMQELQQMMPDLDLKNLNLDGLNLEGLNLEGLDLKDLNIEKMLNQSGLNPFTNELKGLLLNDGLISSLSDKGKIKWNFGKKRIRLNGKRLNKNRTENLKNIIKRYNPKAGVGPGAFEFAF